MAQDCGSGLNFNIGNLFRSRTPAAIGTTNPGAVNQPAPAPAPASGMEVANPLADPGAPNRTAAPGTGAAGVEGVTDPNKKVNPLDSFTDLFKITEDDKKNAPVDPFGEPLLTFDAKKFGEAANKMNFAAGIPPEQMQKALSGDQQAFTAILNRVSQSTFTAAAQVFTGIMEQSFKKNNGRLDAASESRFKTLQLNSTRPTNSALQHPAATPIVEALKATIAAKNPQLRPDEVVARAEEFFGVFAESLVSARPPKDGDRKTGPVEPDWTKYLEEVAGS